MQQGAIPLAGYRRALKFAVPYGPRLLVLLTGVAATPFGLAQPYISKLLIDEALLKRNFDKLLTVSGLMLAATLLNFALNTFSSYQYVKASAAILFDIRLALYRHLQTLSPRFWASSRMGDVVSRINNDVAEVQRVLGGQPAQRAFERRVPGRQRRHHGEPQCEIVSVERGCFAGVHLGAATIPDPAGGQGARRA